MQNIKTEVDKQELGLTDPSQGDASVYQEVKEIQEAVAETVSESSLTEKVDALRASIETISLEVQGWRTATKDTHVEALENLKKQVNEIQSEWDSVSDKMKNQSDRLETLLQSFPGVIETSTLRALSLRLTQLEQLVSRLFEESNARATSSRARKQLIISLVALGSTVVLWGVWIVLSVL